MKISGITYCRNLKYAAVLAGYAFVLLLPLSINAQLILSGKVIDSNNGYGLQGVNILINDSSIFVTDDQGLFSIRLESYPAVIRFSYVGYESESLIVNTPGNLIIDLKASEYLLGEVVVTAYKKEQRLNDIAGSISLLTKKSLGIDNDINVVNALNRLPGIYMHSGAYNTNRLTIRGIGSRTLFGTSKIRAYFDHIPLTSGDGETTIEDIDPGLIERIEIIKGPSSSLYGAGLGGTVLISSDLPSPGEKSIQYQVTGGSYGYLKNALTARTGFNRTRVLAGINNIHNNGYRDNNQFDRFTAGMSASTRIGRGSELSLTMNFIDQFAQIPSSLNDSIFHANPKAAASNWKATEGFEDYRKFLGGINLSLPVGKAADIDAGIFGNFRNSYERRPFGILKEDTRSWGSRLQFSLSKLLLRRDFSLVAGYEYFADLYSWKTIQNLNKSEGLLESDNKETRSNINFFIKADWTLPTNTLLTAGMNLNMTDYKYTDIYSEDSINNSGSYSFDRTLSPRIGLSHPITKHINIYASISHGFSPPSLPETLTPAGDINPDIRPETGINYEIGSRGFIGGSRFYFDLTLFSLQVKNLLVARRIGNDQFVGINAGKTSHRGIEASLNYDFTGGKETSPVKMIGHTAFTISDFKFREFIDDSLDYSGNMLTGVPQNDINAGFDFSLRSGPYANLSYRFVSRIPVNDSNSEFADPYQLINFKAGFRHSLFKGLSADIYGILNNILDEHYASMIQVNAVAAGGNAPRYYYPGLPRNFYAGLIIRYDF